MSERMAGAMMWVRDLITLHDSKAKAEEFLAALKSHHEAVPDFLDANYPLEKTGDPEFCANCGKFHVKGGWGALTPMQTPERLRDWFTARGG